MDCTEACFYNPRNEPAKCPLVKRAEAPEVILGPGEELIPIEAKPDMFDGFRDQDMNIQLNGVWYTCLCHCKCGTLYVAEEMLYLEGHPLISMCEGCQILLERYDGSLDNKE